MAWEVEKPSTYGTRSEQESRLPDGKIWLLFFRIVVFFCIKCCVIFSIFGIILINFEIFSI